jgi:hypothetical protein
MQGACGNRPVLDRRPMAHEPIGGIKSLSYAISAKKSFGSIYVARMLAL